MRWIASCALVMLVACGDSKAPQKDPAPDDAGAIDGAASADAAPLDGPAAPLSKSCVDRPNDLVQHAPTTRLPCELIPPGK